MEPSNQSLMSPPLLTLPFPVLRQDAILNKLIQSHSHNYKDQEEEMLDKYKRVELVDPSLIIDLAYTGSPSDQQIDKGPFQLCLTCNNQIKAGELKSHANLHASHIYQKVYIGAGNNASNLKQLRRLGIGYVLNCANQLPSTFSSDPSFVYKKLTLQDVMGQSIKPLLKECTQFIEQSSKQNRGLLVHCFQGKSRSVTVVIAYLMMSKGLTLKEAYDLVKQKRPQIRPNPSYIKDLLQLEMQLYGRNTLMPEEVLPVYKCVSLW